MKLRVTPIILTVIISAAVLFGGWFTYRTLAMEQPLFEVIHQAQGVKDAQLDIQHNDVIVKLELEQDANLREIVHHIKTNGTSLIGKRNLQIHPVDETSAELDQWWSGVLFGVAQSMEMKQYAQIPEILRANEDKLPGLEVVADMDETNVYIQLKIGQDSKFIVLPRVPSTLGVWSHE